MLTPAEVVDKDFLEHRHQLLEIAAYLDRYDAAVQRTGQSGPVPHKLKLIDQALAVLRTPPSERGRACDLLELFAS
ncbi:MAG: hypothetical protein KF752_12255 [Pirellulaceae bacterium]|nr:hypothetical protein [Pirellulaceae bacterium]